jgi:preprotein translocase subunit YajC
VTSFFPPLALQLGGGSSSFGIALPLVLMFGIMYFLLFLPMQRQKKAQQKMLSELKNGDTVVSSGGIVGTITGLEKDTLVIRVKPDNLKLQITRASVTTLVPPPGETSAVTNK